MRFLSMIRVDETTGQKPSERLMQDMGKLMDEMIYVVENTFVPGRTSRPHFHDQDRYITVVKGIWWVSMRPEADTFDLAKMVPMKAGSFVFHPAFGHHYDSAKDEPATVRIMGMGPVTTTQLEQQSAR